MKKQLFLLLTAAAAALFLTGCVSFQYSGETAPPTGSVRILNDSSKIGQPYRVLGTAVVSGNDQDVSRDRMIEKLRLEGEKCGANVILLVEQQVVPGEVQKGAAPQFMTTFDYDDSSRSWSQIHRDVDQTYGSVRGTPNSSGNVVNYRRVIRAEFLRYLDAPAGKADGEKQGKPAPAVNPAPVKK